MREEAAAVPDNLWVKRHRGTRHPLDPRQPSACFREDERGENGAVEPGAAIFLTNRECPWRCVYCDLWKNTLTRSVPAGAIPLQIDWAFNKLGVAAPGIHPPLKRLKLYNAGSFFDAGAIPRQDYPAIASRARRFDRVIVESHPALIGDAVLRFRDLLAPSRLEAAMGLETAHPQVLAKLNKHMTLDQFAGAAAFLGRHGLALRAFVLVQPPFLPEAGEALFWAQRSLDFAFDCGATVAVLIPVRPGTRALDELARAGQFIPPKLSTLERAAATGCEMRRGRVFADLWDLALFSTCPRCFAAREARLRHMNITQRVPPVIECPDCGG